MCRVTTRSRGGAEQLKKEDKWVEDFDVVAFTADIKALGDELEKQQGDADVRHLNKMIGWSNACAAVGLLTMGLGVNFVSVFALSTWTFTRWTMIAHHTCHGGYDRCHPNKGRWNRFKFAVGSTWRRVNDWLGKWRKLSLAFFCSTTPYDSSILQSIVKIIECRTIARCDHGRSHLSRLLMNLSFVLLPLVVFDNLVIVILSSVATWKYEYICATKTITNHQTG